MSIFYSIQLLCFDSNRFGLLNVRISFFCSNLGYNRFVCSVVNWSLVHAFDFVIFLCSVFMMFSDLWSVKVEISFKLRIVISLLCDSSRETVTVTVIIWFRVLEKEYILIILFDLCSRLVKFQLLKMEI